MIQWFDYKSDLQKTIEQCPELSELEGTSILITGATGLIGSYLVDTLAYYNESKAENPIAIYALSRSGDKLRNRFTEFDDKPWFFSVVGDVSNLAVGNLCVDYIINGASNAHPALYAQDPIGTITTNVYGTHKLLQLAVDTGTKRVLQISTVEIYGENRGDVDSFDENYCGKLNCNHARGGYPESKRVAETLCHAFVQAHDLDVVIARPCRIYGPTMEMSDSKATAQFIKNAMKGQDIVLKSAGTQRFSYAYVGDVVSGYIKVLCRGEKGQAYNIADSKSVVRLAELAEIVAGIGGGKVSFEQASAAEKKGFSGAIDSVLDPKKLESLGWTAQTSIREGMETTIAILKKLYPCV